MVLKLALLASHMAESLIENLRKTLEYDKQRPQTLHVALFNLCYVFYIIFIKHIKWCIVSHTNVQRYIHQIPMNEMIISDVYVLSKPGPKQK